MYTHIYKHFYAFKCLPISGYPCINREAADKVVGGEGKFEELMVCSQEIAASTIQLVVSSKVKADRKSASLSELSEASKGVTEATGQVVASTKSGAQRIEDLGQTQCKVNWLLNECV